MVRAANCALMRLRRRIKRPSSDGRHLDRSVACDVRAGYVSRRQSPSFSQPGLDGHTAVAGLGLAAEPLLFFQKHGLRVFMLGAPWSAGLNLARASERPLDLPDLRFRFRVRITTQPGAAFEQLAPLLL